MQPQKAKGNRRKHSPSQFGFISGIHEAWPTMTAAYIRKRKRSVHMPELLNEKQAKNNIQINLTDNTAVYYFDKTL